MLLGTLNLLNLPILRILEFYNSRFISQAHLILCNSRLISQAHLILCNSSSNRVPVILFNNGLLYNSSLSSSNSKVTNKFMQLKANPEDLARQQRQHLFQLMRLIPTMLVFSRFLYNLKCKVSQCPSISSKVWYLLKILWCIIPIPININR